LVSVNEKVIFSLITFFRGNYPGAISFRRQFTWENSPVEREGEANHLGNYLGLANLLGRNSSGNVAFIIHFLFKYL